MQNHPEIISASDRTSHNLILGYCLWIFGFMGAHRFYYGRSLSGALWFFTLGLLFVGWIIDLFLIPSMEEEASRRFALGELDYTIGWLLLIFLGVFGIHRMYMGKWITGVLYMLSGGLLGLGIVYDFVTLNGQINDGNHGIKGW